MPLRRSFWGYSSICSGTRGNRRKPRLKIENTHNSNSIGPLFFNILIFKLILICKFQNVPFTLGFEVKHSKYFVFCKIKLFLVTAETFLLEGKTFLLYKNVPCLLRNTFFFFHKRTLRAESFFLSSLLNSQHSKISPTNKDNLPL